MVPTPFFVALLALGAIFPVLAGPWAWEVFILYNLVLAALFLWDYRVAPGASDVAVSRQVAPILSLNARAPVVVRLVHRGRHWIELELRDTVPRLLRCPPEPREPTDVPHDPGVHQDIVPAPLGRLTLAPGGEGLLTYFIRPRRRGDATLGPLTLRGRGPLGLARRQFRLPLATPVKVYPDLRDLRRQQLLAVRGTWREAGRKRTRLAGRGSEWAGTRESVAGDDFRSINWTATARRGKLVSNVYETERCQTLMLVLDAGRLMTPLAEGLSKLDHAVNAALTLAYAAAAWDDRVGLLVFSHHIVSYLPPARGRRALSGVAAALYNLEPALVASDYRQALEYLRFRQRKRSLVCLFTDVTEAGTAEDLGPPLAALLPTHLPACIAPRDPRVLSLARQAPENSRAVYEKGIAEYLLSERQKALAFLSGHGVLTIDVLPRELTPATLNLYLRVKHQGHL